MAAKAASWGACGVAAVRHSHPRKRRAVLRAALAARKSPGPAAQGCASFDGKYTAFVQGFNVYLKRAGDQAAFPLSFDGSENNYYTARSLAWSPDSKKLVAYHVRPAMTAR